MHIFKRIYLSLCSTTRNGAVWYELKPWFLHLVVGDVLLIAAQQHH